MAKLIYAVKRQEEADSLCHYNMKALRPLMSDMEIIFPICKALDMHYHF